ncbi:hypothetical protein BU15DRAFT_83417 [Melanogaster broomeanus]|nr:hypothetical protein BU15DRAFT_83417 [Melanogaster broomeanus]
MGPVAALANSPMGPVADLATAPSPVSPTHTWAQSLISPTHPVGLSASLTQLANGPSRQPNISPLAHLLDLLLISWAHPSPTYSCHTTGPTRPTRWLLGAGPSLGWPCTTAYLQARLAVNYGGRALQTRRHAPSPPRPRPAPFPSPPAPPARARPGTADPARESRCRRLFRDATNSDQFVGKLGLVLDDKQASLPIEVKTAQPRSQHNQARNMVANNRDPYFNDQDSRTPPSAASIPFNAQQAGNPAASMLYQRMMNQMPAISNSVLEAWAERSWRSREAWAMWEAPLGGKIIMLSASLPGIGALENCEDPKILGIWLLRAASLFYKTFAIDSAYQDVASLACLPHYTFGQMFIYPAFDASRSEDAIKFAHEFGEVLAIPVTPEALMLLRKVN